MSHFTVLVKLDKDKVSKKSMDSAVALMLAPYRETSNKDDPYSEFIDETKYVFEEAEEIINEKSYLAKKYPDFIGQAKINLYEGDMDEFADYHGYDREVIDGKVCYGHWANPNGFWDWYEIGGRWRGKLPIKDNASKDAVLHKKVNYFIKKSGNPDKPLTADICRFKDLDCDKVLATADNNVNEFWELHQKWLSMREEADRRYVIRRTSIIIKELSEFLEESSYNPLFIKSVNHLDIGTIRNFIESEIEPVCKQKAARFRYLFKINEWDRLEKLGISNKYKLLEAFNKLEFDEFHYEWNRLLWDYNDTMSILGLKTVKTGEYIKDSDNKEVIIQHENYNINMREEPEIKYNLDFTLEDLKNKYRWAFEWSTWAVLDDSGWHEVGRMDMWGLGDVPDSDRESWKNTYYNKHLLCEDLDTILVVVDCHI